MVTFSMRIFIDIGAHFGESTFKALNPKLKFDKIYTYEPSSTAIQRLNLIKDKRVINRRLALGKHNSTVDLFGTGGLGATIFIDKIGLNARARETITVKSASEELRTILESDSEIFLKINCEGAELDILEDLMESGLISNCTHLYIDWDARKIPSLEADYIRIRSKVENLNLDLVSSDTQEVSGWKGVEYWLQGYQSESARILDMYRYKSFSFLPGKSRIKECLKQYIPVSLKIYTKIYKRFQPGQ